MVDSDVTCLLSSSSFSFQSLVHLSSLVSGREEGLVAGGVCSAGLVLGGGELLTGGVVRRGANGGLSTGLHGERSATRDDNRLRLEKSSEVVGVAAAAMAGFLVSGSETGIVGLTRGMESMTVATGGGGGGLVSLGMWRMALDWVAAPV